MTIQEAYAAGLVGGIQLDGSHEAAVGDAVVYMDGDGRVVGVGQVERVDRAEDGVPTYTVHGMQASPGVRLGKAVYTGDIHGDIKLCAVLETCNTRSLIHIQDGERASQAIDRLLSMVPDGAGYNDRATASLVAILEDGELQICCISGEHMPDVTAMLEENLEGIL